MKLMSLHHRIYIFLITCLLVLACAVGWFVVANAREGIISCTKQGGTLKYSDDQTDIVCQLPPAKSPPKP